MADHDWNRLETLFHSALEQPAGQRREWLGENCPDDPGLVERVVALLEHAEGEAPELLHILSRGAREVSQSSERIEHRLGPYRIIERLGQGGMGTVYRAERDDQAYRQQVAIKVIRGYPGDEALARLRSERQILADLQHPFIARLLDGGTTDDGQPFLVMEYIEGRPLLEWCRTTGATRAKRIRLMLRICEAVHFAHRHLIIHRDLKPGNILVTRAGTPRVLDFGIARNLSEPERNTIRPLTFYSPGYASPEQFDGQAVTTATDIYSLGRLLLALLVPEAEPDANGRVPERWWRGLPRDLAAIIGRATQSEPDARYASVEALRVDLSRYLDDLPVEAADRGPGYRIERFLRRHRAAVAAGALALAVTAALGWRWTVEFDRARAAESRALVEARHAERVLAFLLDAISAAKPGHSADGPVSVLDVVDQARAGLLTGQELESEARSRMLVALAEVYQRLESWAVAEQLLDQAVAEGDRATRVRASSLLGYGLTIQQRYDAADTALRRGERLAEVNASLPTGVVRELRNHRALWWLDNNRPEEARDEFAVLAEAWLSAGEREPAARVLHNLGLAESRLGRPERAAEQFRRSLEIKETTTGEHHPAFANTLQALARARVSQGLYEDGRRAMERALRIRRDLFGADHPGLHGDFNELGSMHHDRGEFEQAIAHYQSAIELHGRADASPAEAAIYINNTAHALADRGQVADALPLFEESLAIRLEQLGDEHLAVARARHSLARALIELDRLDEARALIDRAEAVRRDVLGADHQAVAYTQSLRALAAFRGGDYEAARAGFADALVRLGERLPERNWWVLTVRADAARNLIALGEHAEAAGRIGELIDDYGAAFGPDHPHAVALEVESLALGQLADQPNPDADRLTRMREVVERNLAIESRARRQLDCLSAGAGAEDCWIP